VAVTDILTNEQEMLGAEVNLQFIIPFIGLYNFPNVLVRE
jgi:hypothetical protein